MPRSWPHPLLDILHVEKPIIQAPMAGVQDYRLAAAVTNAGGLGSLPCAMLGPDAQKTELQARNEATQGGPYNLNFFAHTPHAPNDSQEAGWRQALAPYYQVFEIDPATISNGPGRMPFNEESAAIVEASRPAVVSFHFGLPEPALLDRVRQAGAKIFSTATTVEEAIWLQQHGADAIIAQGLEAGGHRGIFNTCIASYTYFMDTPSLAINIFIALDFALNGKSTNLLAVVKSSKIIAGNSSRKIPKSSFE